jgi:HK97 gp10 family phage protein
MKLSVDVIRKWDGNTFTMTILPKVEYRSVREAALFCQGQAILLCPVDEGRLRGSIGMKMSNEVVIKNADSGKSEPDDFITENPEPNTAHVGTNTEYAIYQEFGTVNMAAQPYLRPAADLTQGQAVTIIEQAGKAEFEGYKGL